MYPAVAPPLLYLLFLFARKPLVNNVKPEDLFKGLPPSWPAYLGEPLRRDLLTVWHKDPPAWAIRMKQIKQWITEHYSGPEGDDTLTAPPRTPKTPQNN